jgi:hypothetical protein
VWQVDRVASASSDVATFVIPTYLFLARLGIVLAPGLYRSAMAGGHPVPVEIPPAMPAATGGVTLWLLMRAFANVCKSRSRLARIMLTGPWPARLAAQWRG